MLSAERDRPSIISSVDQDLNRTELLIAQEEKQLNGTLKDMIKVRRNFINLMIMLYLWAASNFGDNIIYFQMKYLPGSIFLSTFVSGLADTAMQLVGGLLYSRIGPNKTLIMFFSTGLLGSLGLIFFSSGEEIIIDSIMIMVTKVGIATPG